MEITPLDVDAELIRRDLAQLVSWASVGGSEGEVGVQRWCAATMQGLGLDVDLWPLDLDALRADPDHPGEEVERAEAWGCVGTAGTGTPELILNGHVDVVPPGEHEWWTGHDPWHLHEDYSYGDGGRWYGRGTCDMLGGVAAILGAVRTVGDRLTRPFAVHTVIGEEDGGLGTFATLRRGHTGQACLIAEPTAGAIVAANAGALTFRIAVRGRSTHGSRPGQGISALDLFERVHRALKDLDARRNALTRPPFGEEPWPVSIGIVHAGDWASTVPDLLVAEGRFGVMPGESFAEAMAALEQAVALDDDWFREHPVEVTWPGGRFAAGALTDGHPFGDEVVRAVTATGADSPALIGMPYGSDLRQYIGAGIPTVQYGPGTPDQAHSIDEYVPIDEVIRSAQAYAHLLLARCS